MKKQIILMLLVCCMALALLPGAALANETDSQGTIEKITEVGTVDGSNITVTGAALNWYAKDVSVGRYQDGWWVGVKIVAPASVTDANVANVKYSNDGTDNLAKSFGTNNDGKTADGNYYIGCWLPITPEYLEDALNADSVLKWTYKFDWTGNGTVDQTFTITVDPADITLNKDGNVWFQTVDGVMVIKDGAPVHSHSYGTEWVSDSTNHWKECSCGEKTEKAAHISDGGKVTTAATEGTEGIRTYSCTVCGYVIKTESIPAIGYKISAPTTVNNGTLTVSQKTATVGSTVTITVKPNEGYELGQLAVTDSKSNALTLTDKGNGSFTFTMPASNVTIEVKFNKIRVPVPDFVDVPADAYYADAVEWAASLEITNGTSDNTFSPDDSCTRAQMVTFLWRASGCPAVNGSIPFTDVAENAYYTEAIRWAVNEGITKGTSDTTFSPDDTVNSAQAVTFLYRNAGAPANSATIPFADVSDDAYYADAVLWAVSEGVTYGTGTTTFSPDHNCTRAQNVTFLYRALAE